MTNKISKRVLKREPISYLNDNLMNKVKGGTGCNCNCNGNCNCCNNTPTASCIGCQDSYTNVTCITGNTAQTCYSCHTCWCADITNPCDNTNGPGCTYYTCDCGVNSYAMC